MTKAIPWLLALFFAVLAAAGYVYKGKVDRTREVELEDQIDLLKYKYDSLEAGAYALELSYDTLEKQVKAADSLKDIEAAKVKDLKKKLYDITHEDIYSATDSALFSFFSGVEFSTSQD